MPEVEPTSQRSRTVTGSGQNGNEAVSGAASEASARWLYGRGHIVSPPDTALHS